MSLGEHSIGDVGAVPQCSRCRGGTAPDEHKGDDCIVCAECGQILYREINP